MKINGICLLEERRISHCLTKCFRAKVTIPAKKKIGEDEASETGGEEGEKQEIKKRESRIRRKCDGVKRW